MNKFLYKKVMVLSAHPDDADITMGGTLCLMSLKGIEIYVVNFTSSELNQNNILKRKAAADGAAKLLGYKIIWIEEGKYKQVEEIPQNSLVSIIDSLVMNYSPDAIYTHWEGDSHYDHVLLARAARASSRRWDADFYSFGPSEIKAIKNEIFNANIYVDLPEQLIDRKIDAITQYNYIGQGYQRLDIMNVKVIARYHGLLSGFEYAERFFLERMKFCQT
jgi:LmbE family N-acetylglucosaminyl deacetylase